jgi:hypothetical protein
MPSEQEVLEKIRAVVAEHYQADSSPFLLADLGDRLRKEFGENVRPQGKTLLQYIEGTRDPDLLIVRDKKSPAYVAVATATAKSLVEEWIDRRKQAASTATDLDDLPRSVLIAFCVPTQPNDLVFVRRSPPFKYEIKARGAESDPDLIEIEDRYRRPGLKIWNPSDLNAGDRLDLQTKIASWIRDKNVPIGKFSVAIKKSTNALERLIAAQRDGIAEKIMIPGDIALLLVRHE